MDQCKLNWEIVKVALWITKCHQSRAIKTPRDRGSMKTISKLELKDENRRRNLL